MAIDITRLEINSDVYHLHALQPVIGKYLVNKTLSKLKFMSF